MSLKFLQRKSKKDFMKVLRQFTIKHKKSRRNRTRKLLG